MSEEGQEIIRELVAHTSGAANPGHFVTREEFIATVKMVESKIENSALKTKTWVLAGCLAILISGVGGYTALATKIDRLSESLPAIAERQNTRWPWVQQQQQRDLMQDEILKKLDKDYQPMPYVPPPN